MCYKVEIGEKEDEIGEEINAELCKEIPARQVLFYASVLKVNMTDASS
jgi:hypothetical protein